MEKSDHISVTLSGVGVGGSEEDSLTAKQPQRRSLRRSWNQLPRCQRSLIIVATLAACLTLVLVLYNEQIEAQNGRLVNINGGFSFRGSREAAIGSALVRNEPLPVNALKNGNSADVVNGVNNIDNNALPEIGQRPMPLLNDNAPEFKDINVLDLPNRVQKNGDGIDSGAELLKDQKSNFLQGPLADVPNKISIQEINLNDNRIESPAVDAQSGVEDDDRAALEAAVLNPRAVPGTDNILIADYADKLDSSTLAQKQHFHGATNERQTAVVAAFKHSWNGYKKYAWGHDNLKPLSQGSHDWFGLGLTIVDSLDTMYIMGLEDEFNEGREWVSNFLTFDINRDVNLFEVTIRVLGGLLSAYHLSGDKMFLIKSIELGNRMLPCFLSASGIPYSDVNLASMSAHSPKWSPDSSTSEVTTIQLEFRDLSRSSQIPIYEKVSHAVNKKVHTLEKTSGLVPIFINANTGTFRNYATISLGARGDSYYEYLLKQWLQTGRKPDDFLIMDYIRAIDGVLTKLLRRTPKEQHVYIGELINGKDFKPKMDHLTCYLPGTLLLGHKFGMPTSHFLLARDLLETCYQTYMRQPTQLAPEISYFALTENEEQEIYVKPNDAHNLLRPEFIESLYYFYAITGNRTYQDMGWNIFQAFEKHTKVAYGYTSIGNVKHIFNTRLRDMMESFWLSETLKYFYLLFSDNRLEIDLDKWVFNSEAHLLPLRNH
ncbi:endoplasmic reticulum mannosyl-oligosaccharide 1,2-alpha-mannosidase [Anastrepha obliqua]|uniref:endoplasmic reticulum mannosyl-oligosaccharide 1,2-alpha-mannosidase n=1 Tax=Anastrepha obliqua TaxID=95512 RepID=UPI00240A7CBD|nr:endoplasmic reticulum mannosyl-oligosaccharide 1,2-alpha-mannosidase [Anastrepha obliqua]XP_054726554.1 endoplasmic reticulum mannosyl-oligosaccharide 1,2-alpha-mannosidase [Anastrepha obliqua]